MGCRSYLAGSTLPSPTGLEARKWLGDPHRGPHSWLVRHLPTKTPRGVAAGSKWKRSKSGRRRVRLGIGERCYRNCAETAEKSTRDGNRARGEPGPMRAGLDIRLWEGVARLLDRSISVEDLQSHRLELLALSCWRASGHPIPSQLAAMAREAAMKSLAVPLLLRRLRDSCDGPIVLLKGPETAACYPEPVSRPFDDVDILVPDAVGVQRAFIAAGFRPLGVEREFRDSHQMAPLYHPGVPLLVEVHKRPHWIDGMPPPPVESLFEHAVESVVPIAGISALPRVHNAVLHAVHAWAHEPLGGLRHLIDVAAVRQGTSDSGADALAAAWGIDRLWHTTTAAIDALFFAGQRPWALRLLARHLESARERTVLESHLSRWFAPFAAFPPGRAAGLALRAIGDDLRPIADEDWRAKLGRARTAIRNAFVRRSRHDAQLVRHLVEVHPKPGGDLKSGG